MFVGGTRGPRILLGSVAGVCVDSWERRQRLIIANLLLALGLLALLLVTSAEKLWLVYVVAFAQSAMGAVRVSRPRGLAAHLGTRRAWPRANSLNAFRNEYRS